MAPAQPVTVTDDRGREVRLARPAGRIVALAPSLAETAFAAGAGGRLAGVARHSDFPAAARTLPRIGEAGRIDLERIVALKPDLVLAWRSGNSLADVERLERLKLTAYVSEPRRLVDIARQLRAIGALAGTAADAEAAAAAYERELARLRARHASAREVRVYYEIWRKPSMTVSGAHIISDAIALCGGVNVFAGELQLTPTVGPEAFIAARPEVLLGGSRPGGDPNFARDWRAQALGPLRDLPAYYVDPDLLQRPTPRIVEGVRAVCAALDDVRRIRG